MALVEPGAVRVVHAKGRDGHDPAVHQRGCPTDADESAPGPHAHQRAQADLPEVEREQVTARATPSVNQHHLRAVVRLRRALELSPLAHRPVAEGLPVQQLDEPVRYLTARIEALVDDERVPVPLRLVLAVEFALSASTGVGHVDVADPAIGLVRHPAAMELDPGQVPQLRLRVHRLDHHLTGPCHRRPVVHRQDHGLTRRPLERGPRVLRGVDRVPVDGKQILSCTHAQARLVQG